jgi:hypothetical protein
MEAQSKSKFPVAVVVSMLVVERERVGNISRR